MKKVILSIAVIAALGVTSCNSQTKKETKTTTTQMSKDMAMTDLSFGVRGNCGMCKKTIEKAVNAVETDADAFNSLEFRALPTPLRESNNI